jgi:hypothetical protein
MKGGKVSRNPTASNANAKRLTLTMATFLARQSLESTNHDTNQAAIASVVASRRMWSAAWPFPGEDRACAVNGGTS